MDSANPSVSPGRSRIGGFPGFALATIALTAIAAVGLTWVFTGPGDARAIWISAAVAALSQIAAFPAVRRLTAHNLMVGWGAGSLVRFATLGVYALVAALVLDLPMTAALVSLALFYFVSMVVEPLFLRK
ncbi:MAG TPA: hypothetical protein VFO55_07850 [Gemmatimonadaceae bacterium]|nr:hypothetical protein [Gemmatimonadaceae bacterium]